MDDHILFQKESDFCMAFVLADGRPTWESVHKIFDITTSRLNIYFRVNIVHIVQHSLILSL